MNVYDSSQHVPHTATHIIRAMTLDDIEAVGRIDRDAFDQVRRVQRSLPHPLLVRTPENLHAAFNRPHAGIVIEWPLGRVVGYCFTHVWGSLGWLGTLGVTPRSQGLGLGQAVIAAGLAALRAAGCCILALETMPDSGKNLALYTRQGLEARYMTVLCQGAPRAARQTTFEHWQPGDDQLDHSLREIAGNLLPGLDPTPAARWLMREEGGTTLFWHEAGTPVAFAVLRTQARRQGSYQSYVTVEVAGCHPEYTAEWPRYLAEIHAYGRTQGKMGLVLPVNARQVDLLREVLDLRLEIVHTRVRMVTGDALGSPAARLVLTLAM
ncbi:MAG: GNAT family N-acetyltransferase [Chloroflexi bacterium]|nr:GNAT family N-acetyltransferase [Chloroflexota bacterium]